MWNRLVFSALQHLLHRNTVSNQYRNTVAEVTAICFARKRQGSRITIEAVFDGMTAIGFSQS